MVKIIKINSLTRSEPNPLRWWEKDRVFCSCIIEIMETSIRGCRPGFIHIVGWIIARMLRFKAQNDKGEKEKSDLVAGSKEEKMSTIMLAGKRYKDKVLFHRERSKGLIIKYKK